MTCPNCELQLDLPSEISDLSEVSSCPECAITLHLECYEVCPHCLQHYLSSLDHCPACRLPRNVQSLIPEFRYTYIRNEIDYHSAISYLNELQIIGLDTEGNSLDPFKNHLLLIQLGDASRVFIFDFSWHHKLARESIWGRKVFVAHNMKYDYKMLRYVLGIRIVNIFDTMLAERILTCGIDRRISLKEVLGKRWDQKLDKEIRNEFIEMTYENFRERIREETIEYSARDVQYLLPLYYLQRHELENDHLWELARLEFEVCKVVADMELRGIYVDTQKWQTIVADCTAAKAQVMSQINELLSPWRRREYNLNSTKDLKEIFFHYGIHLESTGDEELAQVDHEFAKLVREYRNYEKQLSAFGDSFLQLVRKETSRVHPSFQQIGADTGRFSCSNPNLQQIPAGENYRECFKSPPGRKLVVCDYSQQELRILASLSGDPKFIKFYEDNVDLHSATASLMFNIPIDQVDKNTHRKVAKTINFGLAYGQGAKKLGVTIGMSEEEAAKMIEKYFSQFTFIRDWLETAAKSAQQKGYSVTLMGRKRYYAIPEKNDPEYRQTMSAIGRQGKNSPIQGSGVDMIKMAMVEIAKQLEQEKLNAFLINAVHDELVVESSEQDAPRAAEIVEQAMVAAGKKLAPNVPIVAEGHIGDYWAH